MASFTKSLDYNGYNNFIKHTQVPPLPQDQLTSKGLKRNHTAIGISDVLEGRYEK